MIGWSGSVHEIQFFMIETMLDEPLCIVHFHIQTNDCGDVMDAKIVQILFRFVIDVAIFHFLFIVWSTEGKKFVRHNPVEITVLDHFIVAILFVVKVIKVEEASLHTFVNSVQTIE